MQLCDLAAKGFKVEEALARFMNKDAVYIKFLKKFVDDPNFVLLKESITKKDYSAATNQVHTIKGVAANLGIQPVFETTNALLKKLRNNELSEVDSLFIEVEKSYTDACNIIREL
ncbi:MAG: Hpt domain-containing protein [Candidatus Ozemobacteraceae bacterium]